MKKTSKYLLLIFEVFIVVLLFSCKQESRSYQITFIDGNDTIKIVDVKENLGVTSFTPVKEGYEFLFWQDSASGEEFDFTTKITKNYTLIAIYQKENPLKNTYIVKYCLRDGTFLKEENVKEGSFISTYIPVREGYSFTLWKDDFLKVYTNNTPILDNVTLFAYWEMDKSTLNKSIMNQLPGEVSDNIEFAHYFSDSSALLSYESDKPNTISNSGYVNRDLVDVEVHITVTITTDIEVYTLVLTTIVKKVTLKPLKKPMVVGYALGSSFAGFNESSVQNLDYVILAFGSIVSGELSVSGMGYLRPMMKIRKYGVRLGISIADFTSNGYRDVIKDADSRKKFVDSIVKVVEEYKIDGIDIDWEYPSYSDRSNFLMLMQELYARLKTIRSDFLITMASTSNLNSFDYASLNPYCDFFNLMTYDYATGAYAYHNSNLYQSGSGYSCQSAIERVLTVISADKVMIGCAFYARYAPFVSSATFGARLTRPMNLTVGYDYIKLIKTKGAVEYYDSAAVANYCIYENAFYTYDSPVSVKAKAKYAKDNGLKGVMIWQLGDEPTGELLSYIHEGLTS